MKAIFHETSKLKEKEISRGFRVRPIHLENLTVTYVDLDPGALLKEHSHPHDQITSIIKGVLRLKVEGEVFDLGPGQALAIPGHAKHSGEVLQGPVYAIDCFGPQRTDLVLEQDGGPA